MDRRKKKSLRIERDAARNMILELDAPKKTEMVEVGKCYGRVLAEDIIARENVPAFPKAPLDGYAFIGQDTKDASEENPVTLKITEEIPAGGVPHIAITSGYAAKILTGAPVPVGANVVCRYEETEFTETEVTFREPFTPDKNIVPVGDDIKIGRRIAAEGEVITPPVAGMFSALGITNVPVYKKPFITIISTGSELLDPSEELKPGKIRNSSYHLIRGYLEEAGADVSEADIISDNGDDIADKITEALKVSDMVVTTGGVSVGDYDLMLEATEKIGARRLFWKVRFRPGGTMLAAEKDGKLILGLSGNPASASLALHIIGMPFVKKLAGKEGKAPERIKAELLDPIKKDSPFGRLVRGKLVFKDGKTYFKSVDCQGNGALSSLLGCDLIADIPQNTPPLEAGTVIEAYYLGGN